MGKQELIDRARDELFSHIHRCGVLQAAESDQDSWMSETIEYLAERYPDLEVAELAELKTIGLRFCKPAISRLKKETPVVEEAVEADGAEAEQAVEASTEATAEATAEDSEATVGAA